MKLSSIGRGLFVVFLTATLVAFQIFPPEQDSHVILVDSEATSVHRVFFPILLLVGLALLRPQSLKSALNVAYDMKWVLLTLAYFLACLVAFNQFGAPLNRLMLQAFIVCSVVVLAARIGDIDEIIRLSAISGALVVALSYLAVASGEGIHQLEQVGAWRGNFPHKNQAGGAIVLAVLFMIAHSRLHATGVLRLFWYSLVASGVFLLWMSESKTAIALLVPSLIFGFLLNRLGSKPKTLPVARAIVLVVFFAAVLFPWYSADVLSWFDIYTSFTGRDLIWNLSMYLGWQQPVFGYGYESFFSGAGASIFLQEAPTEFHQAIGHAHNGYINVFVQGGIFSMLLLTLALLSPAFQLLKYESRARPISIYLHALWFLIIWRDVFEGDFFNGYRSPWVAFLIFAACCSLAARGTASQKSADADTFAPAAHIPTPSAAL